MSDAADWLEDAPVGLLALLDRMSHRTWTEQHWQDSDRDDHEGDYDCDEGPDRIASSSLAEAEVLGSRLGDGRHLLAIDIDIAAWLVPSTTTGHHHLYADVSCTQEDLWAFLDAAAKIGLVEDGYVTASKARNMTHVRAPWIRKGEEPSRLAAQAVAS